MKPSMNPPMFSYLVVSCLLVATSIGAGMAGCGGGRSPSVSLGDEYEVRIEIPSELNRNVDLLFVIDNSRSMRKEQLSLASNFQRFIDALENVDGELLDLHIGVISTNIGAGAGNDIMACEGAGDDGVLQNTARSSCGVPTDRYIVDIANEDGSRTRNYEGGDLAATFSCIAQLGIDGCGFEQPLESMRRALDGSKSENAGFLRENAYLAVVILSDEDDCSARDDKLFSSDSQLRSEMGPLSSFRCFEFGVQCDEEVLRMGGSKSNCVARQDSSYLYDVSEYATFLKQLKSDPDKVIVAVIAGNSTPVSVEGPGDSGSGLSLSASCISPSGKASPAVRLGSLLSEFPRHSYFGSICNPNLSGPLEDVAATISGVIGNACMDSRLKFENGEPVCVVADVKNVGQLSEEESVISKCRSDMSVLPCYRYVEDRGQCANEFDYPGHLSLVIERGDAGAEAGTTTVAHCMPAQADSPSPGI